MITKINNVDVLGAIDDKINKLEHHLTSVLWNFSYNLAREINDANVARNTSSWWTRFNNGWITKYNWAHINEHDIMKYIDDEKLMLDDVIDYDKFLLHLEEYEFCFKHNPMKYTKTKINKLTLMRDMINKCYFKKFYIELDEEEFKLIYE